MCRNGDLRIQDGMSAFDGRVEVCVDGVWDTICNDGNNGVDMARIVCKQLGLPQYGI